MKPNKILIGTILIILLVSSASAGIFTIEDAKAALSIKIIGSTGVISKEVFEKDIKTDTLQTVKLDLTKVAKTPEEKIIQLYPEGKISISSDFAGTTNTMQVSNIVGYPLLEVYYGYQKSSLLPWEQYFRVEQVDADYAYVIFAEFKTKTIIRYKIPRATYDSIIAGGKAPELKTVSDAQVGEKI